MSQSLLIPFSAHKAIPIDQLLLACYLVKQSQRNRSTSLCCEAPKRLLKKLCFEDLTLSNLTGCARQVFLKCCMAPMASNHLSKIEKQVPAWAQYVPAREPVRKEKNLTLRQNPNPNHANNIWIIEIKIQACTPSLPCNRDSGLLSKLQNQPFL